MPTTDNIEHWFTYHPPKDQAQRDAHQVIRDAGKVFALAILAYAPPCADQSAAIRKVREAMMSANAAIACEGH